MQEAVLPVLFRLRDIDELHRQRDGGLIAALVKLRLRRLAHLLVALVLALLGLALGDLLAVGHSKMNPFRRRVIGDVRAVHIDLRQIEHLAILVLASGHDARDHVAHVQVVFDARQVLALPDLDIGIAADALHHEHVKPVPLQLAAVLLHDAAVPEQDVHGILVFIGDLLGGGGQVGIEGEVMLGQTCC